jgi:Glycosyl transferase family 2
MSKKTSNYPFVSVCTPTFNRRPFIPMMFECFKNQTYPKSRIEWIIVDDGTDKIKDLIDAENIPQIKYFSISQKMSLGAKRNFCHSKCKGSIIVYMDDDDYYPPERISHAVEMLSTNKTAMIAGSSEIYVYFKDIKKMYQFGPYNPSHATAGTFAFRRELLNTTRYEEHAALAEERHFLKNWTVPMVQLDPLKTILVFSHKHNTFDKRALLENANPAVTKISDKTVKMFIRTSAEEKIKQFFMNDIDHLLKNYKPGEPRMKPDVLQQIKEIDEQRKKDQQQHQQQPQTIMLQEPGKEPVAIGVAEAVNIVNQQNEQIRQLVAHSQELERMNQQLQNKIVSLEKIKMHETPSKTVSFSDPLEKPSATVQELLKQKDQKIAELETELQTIKNSYKESESVEIRIIEPDIKSYLPTINPIKERSKLEPEFMIKI